MNEDHLTFKIEPLTLILVATKNNLRVLLQNDTFKRTDNRLLKPDH